MNRVFAGHMPPSVARRIMERASESDEPIVVTIRGGKPSRVFGYNEHRKMVELPHRVKPWEHRKGKAAVPDPLLAVDARPPQPLTRGSFYEEE